MLFSQRRGLRPVRSVIQVDDMDDDLRIGLWNALTACYWEQIEVPPLPLNQHMQMYALFIKLWFEYFKQPVDTMPHRCCDAVSEIRNYFFSCEWYEVYDFVEFVADNYPVEKDNERFTRFCNHVLEHELSAYRFVEGKITKITTDTEIAEIEEASEASSAPVATHLKRALDLLADREAPDYRNSIKESISAVEAICAIIADDSKATLGQALKKVEDKVGLHRALKASFSSLYGYTSDADGIRHALLAESSLTFDDAKFMLVSCSAFVNYLRSKASAARIEL